MLVERLHSNLRMSQLVITEPLLFMSVQVASNATLEIARQSQEVLAKIDALLEGVSSDKNQILSATIYLRHIKDFHAVNAVWDQWIPETSAPARTCVEARLAKPELLVEISIIACR